MAQILHLNVRSNTQAEGQRHAALLDCFAAYRRFGDDVFWLKENAELLNILECTGADITPEALAPHQGFYDNVERRIGFFPQYYRFLLSITLDLEDLGLTGTKGEALSDWIARSGLPEAELSDLQRLEARRLLARRGLDRGADDSGLEARVRRFADRSETFALPNKKAAYELTHIVFYLSEYGRRDPQMSDGAIDSLIFAGTLAYLDQNADLLAEICVALRYAQHQPPELWESWLERATHRFAVDEEGDPLNDQYHEFFVSNWLMAISGRDAFAKRFHHGSMTFRRAARGPSALRELSQCLFQMDDSRSDDWGVMRHRIQDEIQHEAWNLLEASEQASDRFAQFFAGFARTGMQRA